MKPDQKTWLKTIVIAGRGGAGTVDIEQALHCFYIHISVTTLVGDSGAVFTSETTRNSVLIATIFMNFALKMVGRS